MEIEKNAKTERYERMKDVRENTKKESAILKSNGTLQ